MASGLSSWPASAGDTNLRPVTSSVRHAFFRRTLPSPEPEGVCGERIRPVPSTPLGGAGRRLADFDPARVRPGTVGLYVFVLGSRADDVAGYWQVEAEGPPGCLRVVAFYPAEDDEGLDVAAPLVVEGVLTVIRHPAWGQFPAVVELQVREARRVRN